MGHETGREIEILFEAMAVRLDDIVAALQSLFAEVGRIDDHGERPRPR